MEHQTARSLRQIKIALGLSTLMIMAWMTFLAWAIARAMGPAATSLVTPS